MKTALLLALCAVVAFAAHSRIPNPSWLEEIVTERRIEDREFRHGREYRFVYDGQLATGVPGSSKQHAATRIQALAVFAFQNAETAILKLTHIRMGKLNGHLSNPRAMVPFEAFEEVAIEEQLKNKLQKSVKFNYNKGLITDMELDHEEDPWSINIKRGVLNMIQINLQKHRRTDTTDEARISTGSNSVKDLEDRPSKKFDFFTVMENTIEGDCETVYTVVSHPSRRYSNGEPVLNVTKSINFEKCKSRPDIRYNFRFAEFCPTCEDKYQKEEKLLESSTIYKFNITGTPENFIIESARVESQYIFAPFNTQGSVIATYVNQTLVLVHTGAINTEIRLPQNPIKSDSDLIYTPDWDIMKEKFFMEGQELFQQKTPYSSVENKVEFVTQILRSLVNQMRGSVKETAPRQFTRLVKMLRMCKLSDLTEIHQRLYKGEGETRESSGGFTPEEHTMVKDMLVDALAIAGTKDSIHHLVEKIKSRQVTPARGAWALKSLVNNRVVGDKMIKMLLDLSEDEISRSHPVVKQAALLTAGSLINALCKDNMDKLAVEFKIENSDVLCPKALREEYVQVLMRKFRESTTVYEKVLVLKTLSNAGLDMSVFDLEKIIKNEGEQSPFPTLIRSQAVEALRHLRLIMPRKIQKILMPIYMDEREIPELRMISVHILLQTLPERPILDQIAKRLFSERSQHVVSYVYTYLRTMANSTNPCEKRMADDLKLSLRHARSIPPEKISLLSKYANIHGYSDVYKMGLGLDFGSIKSNYSFLPKDMALSLHGNIFGLWRKYLVTIGLFQTENDKMFNDVFGPRGSLWEGSSSSSSSEETTDNKKDSSSSKSSSKSTSQEKRRSPRSVRRTPRDEMKHIYENLRIQERRYVESEMPQPMAMIYLRFRDQEYGLIPLPAETLSKSVKELIQGGRWDLTHVNNLLRSGQHFNLHTGMFIQEFSRKIPTTLGLPLRVNVKVPTVASFQGQVRAEVEPTTGVKRVKVVVDAEPSLVSTFLTKVECWSPIVNSGLKVVATLRVHVPLDFEVIVDAEKTPKEVKMVVKTPTERVRLITLETRPITITRVWPRFMKTWEEPEEKTIIGEEWDRVKTIDKKYGEDSLGLRFNVRGQWHRTPTIRSIETPMCPLSGPNKIEITVEPGNDSPKEVEFKLTTSMTETLKDTFKTNLGKFYEKSKQFFGSESSESGSSQDVSSQQTTEDDSEEKFGQYANKYESTNPLKSSVKLEMFTKGSSVKRECEVGAVVKCDSELRHCQYELNILRTPIHRQENEPWKLEMKAQVLYPEIPYTLKDLADRKMVAEVETKWGSTSRFDKFIKIKLEGERSREQERLDQQRPYYRMYEEESFRSSNKDVYSPVGEYEHLLKAARLSQYKISADYNVGVDVKNVTNKLYMWFKYLVFPNIDLAQINVENPEHQIKVKIDICPKTWKYVNITARLPKENMTLTDMPLWMPICPVNIKRRESSSYWESVPSFFRNRESSSRFDSNEFMGVCKVQTNRVSTFDDVSFRVPLSTCYSVLAKDCSNGEQPRFAVLLKKVANGGEEKKLKIISEESVITLEKEEEKIKVEVNGERVHITESEKEISDHGHVVVRLFREGPYIKVQLPEAGVKVYFDGYSTVIKMNPMYQRVQCGLCGHYDQETEDEFRLPNNQITDDIQEFHSSYLYRDSQCELSEDLKNKEEYKYKPYQWSRESSSEESNSNSNSNSFESSEEVSQERRSGYPYDTRSRATPIMKTKVIESGHELCFSKVAIPVCPRGTYAKTFTKEKKVVYSCLPRSDPQSEILNRKAIREEDVLPEVREMPPSFTETELVPETCARI